MEDPTPWAAVRQRRNLAVLLVRHGQTEWNASRRFLGATDIPLDAIGRDQARQLSTALRSDLDHVYSSPLSRAHETASAVHHDPHVVTDLRELDQGELEGMEAPAAFERFPEFFQGWARDPGAVTPPGGENLARCQERVIATLHELASAHRPGEVVAAFSHQLAIASALCGLTGSSLASWRDHRLPNCGISVLEFDGRTWSIARHGWVVGNLGIQTGSGLPDV